MHLYFHRNTTARSVHTTPTQKYVELLEFKGEQIVKEFTGST